jgi:proteasome lid subunit RPN8/RPN11
MSYFAEIKQWVIPANVLQDSIAAMAPDGALGCEGIVMWLGHEQDGIAEITHLVSLRDSEVERQPEYINIPSHILSRVDQIAERNNAYLVGQIHSHPGLFVDLSFADREFGISTPYYLSVVAPHYAQDPTSTWHDCGVHVCMAERDFRRLSTPEVRQAIQVTQSRHALLTTLGK